MKTPSEKQDRLEERLWEKIRIPEQVVTGCWSWEGLQDRDGYGIFTIKGKKFRAHRIVHELVNGLLDEKEVVLHTCDNPQCCNPAHLRRGTQEENMRDKVNKGRATTRKNVLTKEAVLMIREMYAAKQATQEALSKIFEVTRENIVQIVNRKTWRWV